MPLSEDWILRKNSSNKIFEENVTTYKNTLRQEAIIHKMLLTRHSQKQNFRKDTSPTPIKQNEEENLALCNNTQQCQVLRNPDKEVVPNTAITIIAKPNFHGATHNIIQERSVHSKTYS